MRASISDTDPQRDNDIIELTGILRDPKRSLRNDEVERIERRIFPSGQRLPRNIDAVVILGSRNCGYRVERALELPASSERQFIVTGGNLMKNGLTEAENMKIQLVAGGVSARAITKEPRACNTRQNLELILPALSRLAPGRLGLITGGFHMVRTLAAAAVTFSVLPPHVLVPISAFGPHTTPGSWSSFQRGREIIADELDKLSRLGLLASNR